MKLFSPILLLFLQLTHQHQIDENGIVVLTEFNFSESLEDLAHTIVLFHENKDLLPIFNADRLILITTNYDYIPVARIECNPESNIYQIEELTKLPSIRYYRYGKMYDEYHDELTTGAIANFAKTRANSKSFGVIDEDEFNDFLKEDDKVRITALIRINGTLKNQYFNITKNNESLYAHYFTKDDERITLWRPKYLHNAFEDDKVDYNGDDLESWIKSEYYGLVGHRTQANIDDFINPIIGYYNVNYKIDTKNTNYWRNRILPVARNFTKYKFAISSVPEFLNDIEKVGVDLVRAGNKPIIIINTTVGYYYMEDEFSVKNFSNFVTRYDENQLDVYIKSQKIPKFNNEAVKIVVGHTFDEIVMENGKDTMIIFYSPWCVHCRNALPIFTQVAIELKHENVLFAQMDATANYYKPIFKINGVPAIYWLPKNDKYNPIEYLGNRTVKDFVNFIAKNSTKMLKKFDRSGRIKLNEL